MAELLSASSTSAGQLFSNARFTVPEYQREYAWTTTEVSEFWSDVKGSLNEDSYFLGLLIFTKEDGRSFVVDGQQRLLTLTLMADALRRAARSLGRRALTERLESTFLYAMNYDSEEVEPRLKLTDRAGDRTLRDALESGNDVSTIVVPDELSDSEEDAAASVSDRILATQRYLYAQLMKDLADYDSFKRLGQWSEFLLEKLIFAVFVHPDRNAAYKVFEVVNARGRELTTADLIKSYVLSESTQEYRDTNYVRWLKLTEAFRNGGHESQFVQFIRHVVTLHHGFVLPSNLYKFISTNYKKAEGVELLLDQLESQQAVYEQIMDPTSAGPLSDRLLGVVSAFDLLGLRGVRPMLMAIARSAEADTGGIELLRLVVKRVVVGNFGTGNIERRFSNAAHAVWRENGEWRAGLETLADLEPERAEFEAKLRDRSFNKDVLLFLRSSISQQTVTPSLDSYLYQVRPRIAGPWPGFGDEEFKVVGSTLGNSFLSTEGRRPKGSSTPVGFVSLLWPTAAPAEPLAALSTDELAEWDANRARAIGSTLAHRGADLWYAAA
ncbi:DUF262 domain-containing protein [Homoserinibacter gongjuensis]|uniref:GmrSD restriction endonucleases N-terminal domain-containing protein n=1 Tax=Homoserinibacter gongjuensis TaxID=1162968 RepID=A0ABQ6JW53_9MICO|nr:DUF262 domain-containing protein [Homoserinibacter gongjuensis]GMA91942.1 hypothetical protein GCM10025869_24710 [Homoserinibacter gongjuensis]